MKKILLYLILIMAVGMAGIVAYVSVGGLLKVFSGAGTLGLLFFSSIEIAKIVATSAIHTYGKRINWIYKGLLSLGIGIAMLITSVGIYGFLSSTYKETFMKLENVEAQVALLEKKRDGIQVQLDNVNRDKTSVETRITELSKGLSNNVIQYKDPETGQIITTTSSSTRRALERQLNTAIERQDVLNTKADGLNDKVFELDNQITEVKVGNDTAAELGPLKYLAEVTGKSMDEVMKYFILLLIVIGDPMAVLMVIVFNKVANKEEDEEEVKDTKPFKGEIIDIFPTPGFSDGPYNITDIADPTPEEDTPTKSYVDEAADRFRRKPNIDPETGEINIKYPYTTKDFDEEIDAVSEEVKPTLQDAAKRYEELIEKKEEPKEDKVSLEEVKEANTRDRGFSVKVPNRKKGHTVNRIGSNKETRNGNADKVIFKRR